MKSNLDQFFKSDKKAQAEGVWFTINDQTSFKIRHFDKSNPIMSAAMAKYFKPFAAQVKLGTLSEDKQQEIFIKIFVEVCLADWKGVIVDEKELEFSKEAAMKIMTEYPPLFDALWTFANTFDNYKVIVGEA